MERRRRRRDAQSFRTDILEEPALRPLRVYAGDNKAYICILIEIFELKVIKRNGKERGIKERGSFSFFPDIPREFTYLNVGSAREIEYLASARSTLRNNGYLSTASHGMERA